MGQAVELLLSGMITIFVVLSLVVGTGQLLINLVNRWAPEELSRSSTSSPDSRADTPSPAQLAAIVAAVEVVTQGKGRITTIQKEMS